MHVKDLKAIFFVKDFTGRPGFFMVPADHADNNIERCYVVTAATSEVTLL